MLAGKKIVLGVSGGIAAYKSAELIRGLRELGAKVRVIMTQGAQAFITPLTLQTLSGQRVLTDLFDVEQEAEISHIEVARWADMILIAPATANVMAKLAGGYADDLLTTVCLATTAPIYMAPAMNKMMWQNTATQHNKMTLLQRGVCFLGPGEGWQACGEIGPGRMLNVDELIKAFSDSLPKGILKNKTVMITAGPTREAIDPVRYLSNRSSGKMGYALAEAAQKEGAHVILVSGPTALTPPDVECIHVTTANEMLKAVKDNLNGVDIFIGAAAVSDYCVETVQDQKIKKNSDELNIKLIKNPDILSYVASLENKPFCVGFAAETHDVEKYALHKMKEKGVDMIVANDVSRSDIGFDSDANEVLVFIGEQRLSYKKMPKPDLAGQLVQLMSRGATFTFKA